MSEASLIGGASLSAPQTLYTADIKQARIQAERSDWSLTDGKLHIAPTQEWREEHKSAELTATFSLRKLLPPWRPDNKEDTIILGQLFTLLTKHHLLSRPELILTQPPVIIEDANEALSLFQQRIHTTLDPKSFQGLYCEQCEKSKWGSLSSQERYRIYWYNRTNIEICPHARLLSPALQQMLKTFPELIFEALGLITPERSAKSKSRPTRYTLTTYAYLASLGQKLLGFSSVYRVGDQWVAEEEKAEPLMKAKATKLEPRLKEYKASVFVSASAWGYTGRAEALENQQQSDIYPTLGGAELPPKEEPPQEEPKPTRKKEARSTKRKLTKEEEIINFIEAGITSPEEQTAEPPATASNQKEAPETEISMDARIFLQQIGDENETLDRMMSRLKSLAPSVQRTILALPMKTVIELLFDLDEEGASDEEEIPEDPNKSG